MKPRLSDLLASARVVRLPLKIKFRGLTARELLVFEGPMGASEWAAFTEYGDEEASQWLKAAIEWGYQHPPAPKRTSIAVNAILPAVEELPAELASGYSSVKIKVGEEAITKSLDRIAAVRTHYPQLKIRLDANGSYTMEQAVELISRLQEQDIALEYFEQPVASIAELAELKLEIKNQELDVLIAADESVRKSSDPLAVELATAADILVFKSAPLGGIARSLELAATSSLPVVPSSALQSSIGLAAELHFAASLETLPYASGLATATLFEGDLTEEPLIPSAGYLELRRPQLDNALVDKFSVDDERRNWWLARLERCGRILGLES